MKTHLAVLVLAALIAVPPLSAQDAPPPAAPEAPAKASPPAKETAKETTESLVQKARDLEHTIKMATIKIAIGRLEAQVQTEATRAALATATRGAARAQAQLAHFDKVVAPTRLTEATIALDAVKNRAEQAKDEYAELVAMYKAEEFAEMTKELVLKRGRHQLDLANRRLAVQQGKLADLRTTVLPHERAQLAGKLLDARSSLKRAELSVQINRLKLQIAQAEAARALTTAQRALDAVRKKLTQTARK